MEYAAVADADDDSYNADQNDGVPVDVFVGVDVGETIHHAVALDAADGEVFLDRSLPRDEAALVKLIAWPTAWERVLFVVDSRLGCGRSRGA